MEISRRGWVILVGTFVATLPSLAFAADSRAECAEKLKRIGAALQKHHEAHDAYPGNIVDQDGKPLLSWRVALLPFLEKQAGLHDKFRLDEPWDSPRNKSLLGSIPDVFRCSARSHPRAGDTHYRGFDGRGTFFESGRKVGLAAIIDGPSNSLAVVESKEGTPWTKPDDLPFDESAPPSPSLYGAGSEHPDGFNALFADGSVRFLKTTIKPAWFKAIITVAGGEPFD